MINFRSANAVETKWFDTYLGTGFSNFQFVDNHFNSSPVLRRIFSLARKVDFKSVAIEKIIEADCELLREENDSLALREPKFISSDVYRILFFKGCQIDNPQELLGYAIFKKDLFKGEILPRCHVYESVMKPGRSMTTNNYIHCARTYKINTSSGEYTVAGVLYAQQNDLTYVCAHVALRTALASVLPEADISYSEINRFAGIDHTTTKVGQGENGLNPDQMEAVIKGCKIPYTKIVHEPKELGLSLPGDFQRDLYGIIESGYPALLGFELDDSARHIIPVIGHTFNEDTWVAESGRYYFSDDLKYFSSENWLSTYVVHDDNFGPYYCLPRHYLKKDNFRIILGFQRHQCESQAVDVEAVALTYAKSIAPIPSPKNNGWRKRFNAFAMADLLVLRTILLRKEEYIDHLSDSEGWEGQKVNVGVIEELKSDLPEWLWMVELSAPELFSATRRKFGEVLLRADISIPSPLDFSLLLAFRLPGHVIQLQGGSIKYLDSEASSHTQLFQLPLLFCE
jgi:hypothetical protein